MTTMRYLLSIFLFSCGFVLANTVIGLGLPESIKMELLKTQQSDVDVLFLGSSHVLHQVDPALFDSIRGDGNSLNLGNSGMTGQELLYSAERILSMNLPKLKVLVVEGLPWKIAQNPVNDFSSRTLAWHNASMTRLMLDSIRNSDLPKTEKEEKIWNHVEHWWRRSLHLAQGLDAWNGFRITALTDLENARNLGPSGDGFLPLEMETVLEMGRKNRQSFLANPRKLFAAKRRLSIPGEGSPAAPVLLSVVDRIQRMASGQGVEIVWWLHPNLGRTPGWHAMNQQGLLDHFIAFDDPLRFPEFYEVKWRFDLYHLNKEGSAMLTRALAQDFLALDLNFMSVER